MKKLFVLTLAVLSFAAVSSAQTTWEFDKAHTSIGFSISHMVVTDVTGRFKDYEGSFTSPADDNFENSDLKVMIKTASIDTDNEKRDEHLRSNDFFDSENKPDMTFVSNSFKKVGDNKYKISGKLTMNGITKDVELDATYRGTVKDPWGNTRTGFKATTTLDRYEYDLKYNSTLEAGGLLIGQTVDVEINVELIKKS